jgi:hypothetical protein
MIITDEEGRYRLQYDRVSESREWTMPMEAMEDITILRQNFPLSRMDAPEQDTGAPTADLPQSRTQWPLT